MSKKNYTILSLFIWALAVIYVIAGLLFSNVFNDRVANPTPDYWWSFGFGVFHSLVCVICMNLISAKGVRAATEATAVPFFTIIAYLIVAVGMNIVFMAISKEALIYFIIIGNLLVLAVYILSIYVTLRYVNSLAVRTKNVEQRVLRTSEISKQIGNLLARVTDEDVRKRLLRLKEEIDYSSNMSSRQSGGIEASMMTAVSELYELVGRQTDPRLVLQKIEEVERIWQGRNAIKA